MIAIHAKPLQAEQQLRVILDADTANEVDDLFALSRALIEPSWNVLSLNATQWQTSHWTEPRSMENSHRLNQMLLAHLNQNVKTRRGGPARMYDWGDKAQHSAATYEIINKARETPEGEKLTVVALGALTNVASAIYVEPEIESQIKLYWLGTQYDFDRKILKSTDFNAVMDIQAVDILFDSEVEMHVMPVNVAAAMQFSYTETEKQLRGSYLLGELLMDRWWQHQGPGRNERVLWDLALIEAIIHPEWAPQEEITTSRDRGNRTVNYYRSIEADRMKQEFFETLEKFFAEDRP